MKTLTFDVEYTYLLSSFAVEQSKSEIGRISDDAFIFHAMGCICELLFFCLVETKTRFEKE